ncbi:MULTISPECIES: restriction endonuclease subunit S [Sphingobacterium]|uniref:restriction endonuclease subunit S n=1 Tax=Sphingobacterium TaxID=28453 RepID=UPI002579B640|nr:MULTISPECIES: restriction endonuclease subunit S [Sphingobacterium]
MQRYEKYKDSGIDWLGEIPEHWNRSKLKYLCAIYTGYTPPTENKDNFHEDGVLWVKPNNLQGLKYIYETDEKVSLTAIRKGYLIPINSILVCSIGTIGKIGIAGDNLITNQQINSFVFNEKVNSGFSKYMVFSAEKVFDKFSNGNVVKIINTSAQKEIVFCLPPVVEQESIANFLDEKCEKVDATVSLKEQQIEKLKELRQITIHNAITKGLPHHAKSAASSPKMKNSRVDWIGKIPEHWEVKKLKYIFYILKRIAGEEGYDVLSITQRGIKVKDVKSGEGQLAMDYSKYQFAFEGDFAMNHMDLLTGWVDISKYNGVISPDYRVFRLIHNTNIPLYFLALLQDCYTSKMFYAHGQGVSMLGRWRFPTENFNNFFFPVPPPSEQQAIVTYLEEQTSKIDSAIAQKQEQIAKLKEYKQSLINEVVTGKLKVVD